MYLAIQTHPKQPQNSYPNPDGYGFAGPARGPKSASQAVGRRSSKKKNTRANAAQQ